MCGFNVVGDTVRVRWEAAMEIPFYLLLGVVLYVILADSTDRAVEREMRKRRVQEGGLHLVDEFRKVRYRS